MLPSEEVVVATGGAWHAPLNHIDTGGGCMVTTQRIVSAHPSPRGMARCSRCGNARAGRRS